MLYIIAIVLTVLWMLGVVTTYTMLGLVHVTVVIAVVVTLLKFIGVRRAS